MLFNKHLFALYTTADLNDTNIRDETLWLRIVKVLRLHAGSEIILFNNTHTLTLTLSAATFNSKNIIYGNIKEQVLITPLVPTITLLQGIPKKSVFEEIIYNAAQLGVATIIPVYTNKAHDLGFSPKEQERFRNIMITACEQAKQFTIPSIKAPITFEQAISIEVDIKILFDSNGIPCRQLLPLCKKISQLAVLFGPEGGLTEEEITTAQATSFTSTQLTPTILRSKDAPLVGIGLLRTLIA
jgi:16S rRNA (uracil1498-N3)-methyltransferase